MIEIHVYVPLSKELFLFKSLQVIFHLNQVINCLKCNRNIYNILIPDLMTKTSQTDTPKICLKNMQTAFVSYVI